MTNVHMLSNTGLQILTSVASCNRTKIYADEYTYTFTFHNTFNFFQVD